MSYSVPSSTKILTLTTAPFLFISVGALFVCEFAMVPVVYILLCPQEEEVHSSSWGDLVQKRMKKWIFPKSCIFWKMYLDLKKDKRNNEIYTVYCTSGYEAL